MKKIILGLGAAVGLSVTAVAIAAPTGLAPAAVEKNSSSLAVKLVATANQAEEAAFVALGNDAAAIAAATGNRPVVAGEEKARPGQSTHAAARDAAASEDVIALIVVAIENDIKAQVAAGVPTLSISTALTRASNTPNLSKNVAAAFGRVQHDLSDLFDQTAPGSINGRRSANPFAASTEMAVGGPTRRTVSNGSTGGGSDGGSAGGGSTGGGSDGGSAGGGSTGGGSDGGSAGGGSTGGGSDGGSAGGGSTGGGSDGGSAGGGSTGGGSDGGSAGGGSTGGGSDGGSAGGGSTGGGSDGGSAGGGSTGGGSTGGGSTGGGSTVTPPTDTSGGSGYRPG